MVHVRADRVTPLAIPLIVVIGREAVPSGSADEALLKMAEEALAAAAMTLN